MYCEVEHDLRRYEAEQDEAEANESARIAEEKVNIEGAITAALQGDIDARVKTGVRLFHVFLDADVQREAFRALCEAATRGEKYAIAAMSEIEQTYLEGEA